MIGVQKKLIYLMYVKSLKNPHIFFQQSSFLWSHLHFDKRNIYQD